MVASPITGCGVNQQITQVKLALSSPFTWNRELDNTWFVCGNRHAISGQRIFPVGMMGKALTHIRHIE